MRFFLVLAICSLLTLPLHSHGADKQPGFSEILQQAEEVAGFLPLYRDPAKGQIYLRLGPDTPRFILHISLATGIGSNDIGLDRGRLGPTYLVSFERTGNKVLLTAHNTDYRAVSANPAEQQAATDAFASSVLWGFKVLAEQDDEYLIDYTDFLISDSYGVAARLKQAKAGEFKADSSRSAPYFPHIRNFPANTELEAKVTFTGRGTGRELQMVSPSANAVTVHLHHSLVQLPEPGYELRPYHPASGYYAFSYVDYSSPFSEDKMQRFISRHRISADNPIIYYLDPGVPEPIRSALAEGAGWWQQAFAAAGYTDGFQVRLLPEGADPMDIRYNVIQWVHRRTRGWSYGMSIRDPRTGEILKGKVTLGSLRIRQDMTIAQGLLSPFKAGRDRSEALEQMEKMALARIRQLAAHEVGHTLGLVHNYAASTQNQASVMDYPHPLLKIKDGKVDLSDAYDTDMGEWDVHAIRYGYTSMPADQEPAFLADLISQGRNQPLQFITDRDARAAGGAHPTAHLWDDGSDIISTLENTLAVRQLALNQFGLDTLPVDTPMGELENVLVPIYYLHRYQTEAVNKLIGGARYQYDVRGGAESPLLPLSEEQQRRALAAVMATLDAELLTLPKNVLHWLHPKSPGYRRDRESPPSLTQPLFDAVSIAEAAAEETLKYLLQPQRLARLAQQQARDQNTLGPEELFTQLIGQTLLAKGKDGLTAEIQKRIDLLVTEHLLMISFSKTHAPEVSATARLQVRDLQRKLSRKRSATTRYLADMMAKALEDQTFERQRKVARIPPGSPI